MLGEVILATVQAVQRVLVPDDSGSAAGHAAPVHSGGVTPELVMLALGALLIVLSLWWLYFKRDHVDLIGHTRLLTWVFSYGHYLIFSSVAAVGAALAAAVDVVEHVGEASSRSIGLALAIPLAIYALTLSALHAAADGTAATLRPAAVMSIAVLVAVLLGLSMGPTVLLVGLATAGAVAQHVVVSGRGLAASR